MIRSLLLWAAMALALAFLALTFVNASWLAGPQPGGLELIAEGGVGQPVDEDADCPAAHARPADHVFLENTIPGFHQAFANGADWVTADIAETADGALIVFGDDSLDCRTDGTGPVSEATLAEIRRLDAGYGYTPDGGESYPLRGKGVGLIPSVADTVEQMIGRRLLFRFASDDPSQADRLVALLENPRLEIADYYGFTGAAAPVERVRELVPDAWAFTMAEVRRCTDDYVAWGWTGRVPESCENGTIGVALDNQFLTWGFPDRLAARMRAAGARTIVFGPGMERGLTEIEQLTRVPQSYTGKIWIEDIWTLGPALRN